MSEVDALRLALKSCEAQLTRQNAGLVQMARERDALRAELAQQAALRAELAAEVKRLRVFEAAELQRRAIVDAMSGGES